MTSPAKHGAMSTVAIMLLMTATIIPVKVLVVLAAPFDYNSASPRSPSNWAQLVVNGTAWTACSGNQQSPIDLVFQSRPDSGLEALDLFSRSATFQSVSLMNDGAQLEVSFDVTAGVTKSKFADPNDGGRLYDLQKIAFHVHSEHTFGGYRADLEAHMVYTNVETRQVGRTRTSVTRTVVVVTTYVASDASHHIELGELLSYNAWPAAPLASEGLFAVNRATVRFADGSSFDPFKLLPASRDYLTYGGSLTVPPCTEGVTYYVMTRSGAVSTAQVRAIIALLGTAYVAPEVARTAQGNNRPIQSANGRSPRWFVDGASGATQTATGMSFRYPSSMAQSGSDLSRQYSIAGIVCAGLAIVVSVAWVPRNLRLLTAAAENAAEAEKQATTASKYKKIN